MTNNEYVDLHYRQQQMIVASDSLESRCIETPGITMLIGTLMVQRSSGLVVKRNGNRGMHESVDTNTLKKDILTAAQRSQVIGKTAVIPAAGVLQAQQGPKKHTRISCFEEYTKVLTPDDLLIIEDVDYDVRSGNASNDMTEYLGSIINERDKFMILTIGSTSKDLVDSHQPQAYHPILSELAHGFAVTNEGVIEYEFNYTDKTTEIFVNGPVGKVTATIEKPLGRQQLGLN